MAESSRGFLVLSRWSRKSISNSGPWSASFTFFFPETVF
jgi:hypothetical protein